MQVRDLILEPKVAPVGNFTDAYNYRETFPDGRIGSDPTQTTVENGETLIQLAADCVAKDFERFIEE